MSDWANAKKAIVITDMTKAEPSTVFSPKPKKGHWMTIPYEVRYPAVLRRLIGHV